MEVTFGIVIHSSKATPKGTMAITNGGLRIVLETTDGCAIAMITEDEWTTFYYMIVKDIMWVVANISRNDLEATIMIFWTTCDVDMHGADMHPNSKVTIHMSKAILIDSSKTMFESYAWRGRAIVLIAILLYPKVILAHMQIAVWRDEGLDNLGMHYHFIRIEVWSSWIAFFRIYKDAFLAIWVA